MTEERHMNTSEAFWLELSDQFGETKLTRAAMHFGLALAQLDAAKKELREAIEGEAVDEQLGRTDEP